MKKIIAMMCAALLVFSAAGASAAELLSYGEREKNPALSFPIDEKIVMKNGSLVIEAEDMVFNESMAVVEDSNASGGKALVCNANRWADTEAKLAKSPSYMTDIMSESKGSYCIWIRVKCAGQFSLWTTNDGKIYKVWYTTGVPEVTAEYRWEQVTGSYKLEEGLVMLGFHYRNAGATIDKIIVTKDTNFEPKGKDDVPAVMDPNDNGIFPLPDVVPTNAHPRVLLSKAEIPQIKANAKTQALAASYKKVSVAADERLNCRLPELADQNNYNNSLLDKIQKRAFMHAIGERDKQHARQTVSYLKDYIDTVRYNAPGGGDATYRERSLGENIFTIGLVYDWCYDILNDTDKEYFIRKAKEFAAEHAVGYPPTKRLSISGHGTEDGVLKHYLTAGIAFYDEDPEMYNLAAGRILSEMRDAIELYTSAGAFQNGNAYGMARYDSAIYAMKLFESMGKPDIFGVKFADYAYKLLYEKLPIGIWFKDADDWMWTNYKPFTYNTSDTNAMMAGAHYGNPYAMRQLLINMSINSYSGDMFTILFYNPIPEKELDEMPLAYHMTYPFSAITARTSWQSGPDTPTAMARMCMNDVNLGDHYHNDVGAFQFWYKGMLALQSGAYQAEHAEWGSDAHWDYNIRSIAHNTLLIHDPNEKWYSTGGEFNGGTVRTNDGGQRSQWSNPVDKYEDIVDGTAARAVEKGWYIGPNEKTPEFSYISSDLTPAYNDQYTSKAEKYDRSMAFMDLFNEEYPAALVVYDRVKSSNKDFKKTWLLHSEEEPIVEKNITTIKRTDNGLNGKLVNTTLLPAASTITKVGGAGKEFWVDGQNVNIGINQNAMADAGKWRIELSPKNASQNDTFLNVMYVTDNDKSLPQLEVKKVQSSYSVGAVIRDRVITFATGFDKINATEHINIPATGFETYSCLMNDMASGIWKITAEDGSVVYTEVKEGNYSLYFKGAPGTYTIEKAPEGTAVTEITYPEATKKKTGDFYIYNANKTRMIYQDKPTKLIDGVPYVPADVIAPSFGATVSANGASVTVSKSETAVYTADSLTYTLNGEEKQLQYVPKLIDGTVYVAFKDLEKVCDIAVTYDSYARLAKIRQIVKDLSAIAAAVPGMTSDTQLITPVSVSCSANDGNIAENVLDLDMNTRWSSEGTDEYLLFDLGAEYELSKIWMAFYSGDKRSTTFEILTSQDNESFTRIFAGQSSGTTANPETFSFDKTKARYVKIIYHGNNLNFWNSVSEVIFPK